MRKHAEQGFSLIELLIVVGIIGIIAAIAVPMLMDAIDRARQRRTMGDMHTLITANSMYKLDHRIYAPTLNDLQGGEYLQVVVFDDAWGTPFLYVTNGDNYDLRSLGRDGAIGPPPPTPWVNDPFEPDISVQDGVFVQMPSG